MQDIVLMVVWLLATPDSFRSVSLRFQVSPSTLYLFYIHVIDALKHMSAEYIKWPNAAEREEIKQAFHRVSGFPVVIGCVDGTHIYITAPVEDAVHYRNRSHSYSMNVQVIVDNELFLRDICMWVRWDVGTTGECSERVMYILTY